MGQTGVAARPRAPRGNVDARRLKKEALVSDATRALLATGLRQTTMDDIAAAAGTSKVVLYRYFASKEDLIHSALERVADRFVRNERRPYAGIGTGVSEALQIARDDPDGFLLLFKLSAADFEFGGYLAEFRGTIVDENIKRMRADKGLAHLDPALRRMCAESIATLVVDAITRWIEDGDAGRDDEFGRWLVASLKGLYRGWSATALAEAHS